MAVQLERRDTGDRAFFDEAGANQYVDNAINRCVARIFQRDGQQPGKAQQPFLVYNLYGEPQNAADESVFKPFHNEVRNTLYNGTARMTPEEKQYMGMVLPDLVSALVLDKQHVTSMYQKDLPATIQIALDWFKNPQGIDKTHIVVGFGGEEAVNSRIPAYIVPALQTLEKVRAAFLKHGNWAIHHELIDQLKKDTDSEEKSEKVNDWMANQIRISVGPKTREDGTSWTKQDYLEEIHTAANLPVEQMRKILQVAWIVFKKEQPDMDTLEDKYHFTDKLPQLVVMNAANAAVEIDKMEREKTLAARDMSQTMIKEYVAAFHPHLKNAVAFQNDTPWDTHDAYTELVPLFFRDFADTFDGQRTEVKAKLREFGKHHLRDQADIKGVPGSELYTAMHVAFFGDPMRGSTDWAGRLPRSGIMNYPRKDGTSLGLPRHVIFHQAKPEVEFGVDRKLISENATATKFLEWLDTRKWIIEEGAELAHQAYELAKEIQGNNKNEKRTEFVSFLGEAIKRLYEKKNEKAKRNFIAFLGSQQFVEAHDKEQGWLEYWERKRKEAPKTEEAKAAELRKIDYARALVEEHALAVNTVKDVDSKLRDQSGDEVSIEQREETMDLIAGLPFTQHMSRLQTKLEAVVEVGHIPTYYLYGSDARVWPDRQLPSLEDYERDVVVKTERKKRLEGTVEYIATKILPQFLIQKESTAVLSDETQAYLISQNTGLLKALFEETDLKETAGMEKNELVAWIKEETQQFVDRLRDSAHTRANFGPGELGDSLRYVSTQLVPQLVARAKQAVLEDATVDVAKAQFVLHDYRMILSDIDEDPQQAEEKYHIMLQNLMASHNGNGHQDTDPTDVFVAETDTITV